MYKIIAVLIASLIAVSGCTKAVTSKSPIDELPVLAQDDSLPECRGWFNVDCRLSPELLESEIQNNKDVNTWNALSFEADDEKRIEMLTPLLSAALRNDVRSAKRLVDAGADPNLMHPEYKHSLLSLAAYLGNPYSVQILLKLGANVSNLVLSPVAAAAANKEHGAENIRILTAAGADPNAISEPILLPKIYPIEFARTIKNMKALLDVGAKPHFTRFAHAADLSKQEGWIDLLKRLIAAGLDVNASHEEDQSTLLMHMAMDGSWVVPQFADVEAFRMLIDAGADINARDAYKKTALHYAVKRWVPQNNGNVTDEIEIDSKIDEEIAAAENAKYEIIKTLIERGADLNAEDVNGVIPIGLAVSNDDCRSFKMLADAGADLKKLIENDGPNNTVIEFAVRCGEDEVRALIDAGMDVNQVNTETNHTPLCYAMLTKKLPVIRALMASGAVLRNDSECDDDEFVSFLLSKDMNKEGLNGDDVRRLIQAGANPNSRSNQTLYTPLMAAARNRLNDIFFAVLDSGGNIDDVDSNGESVLHFAAFGGSIDIVNALIKKKANVKSSDKKQRTPLMFAKNPEVVQALAEAGSIINAVNLNHENPLLYAVQRPDAEDAALMMIKYGAKINVKNYDGLTPLTAAVKMQYHKLFDVLVQADADIHAKNNDGISPLMAAAKYKNIYAVRSLLEHGAHIDEAAKNGMTPLLYSLEINAPEDIKNAGIIADILISRGAAIPKDEENTFLKAAVRAAHVELVERLLKEKMTFTESNEDGSSKSELEIAVDSLIGMMGEESKTQAVVEQLVRGNTRGFEHELDEMSFDELLKKYKERKENIRKSMVLYEKICDLLIEAGADPKSLVKHSNALNRYVDSPYLTRLMLKAGADPNKDFFGSTPLMSAIAAKNTETMQILIDGGADLSEAYMLGQESLLHGNAQTLKKLVDNGLDLTQKYVRVGSKNDEDDGKTLLMLAFDIGWRSSIEEKKSLESMQEFLAVLKVLTDGGSQINAQDAKGRTALFYAVDKGDVRGIKHLLDAGADVSIRNGQGKTAIDYAIENKCDECLKVLKK